MAPEVIVSGGGVAEAEKLQRSVFEGARLIGTPPPPSPSTARGLAVVCLPNSLHRVHGNGLSDDA